MAEINLEQTFNLTFSLHLLYSFLNIHDNTKSQNLSERVFPPLRPFFSRKKKLFRYQNHVNYIRAKFQVSFRIFFLSNLPRNSRTIYVQSFTFGLSLQFISELKLLLITSIILRADSRVTTIKSSDFYAFFFRLTNGHARLDPFCDANRQT